MYLINLSSLALLALLIPGSNGNRKIVREISGCFNDHEGDKAAIAACLAGASPCFGGGGEAVDDIQACVDDKIANVTNGGGSTRMLQSDDGNRRRPGTFEGFEPNGNLTVRQRRKNRILKTCLKPYRECIREEVRTFIDNLPACLNETATALGSCYKLNAATCNSTCSLDDIPASNPYASGSVAEVRFCNGFQNKIMNPSCAIVDCCEPCVSTYEALMNCVAEISEVADCDLTCPADSSRRQLRFEAHMDRLLQEDDDEEVVSTAVDVSEECASYLDTKEATVTADALNAKILEGEFTACIQDVALSIAASTTGSAAASLMATASMLIMSAIMGMMFLSNL